MTEQLTDTVLMIRPVAFRSNEETAKNNYYQQTISDINNDEIQKRAEHEFDSLVARLRSHRINVVVIQDTPDPSTPDSIFPNNWISFHDDCNVILYPMFAKNRRLERRAEIWDSLRRDFVIKTVDSLADWEKHNQFLEGTGSMILDRVHKLAYAALSDRTNPDLLNHFCQQYGYKPIGFHAYQTVGDQRLLIYHTNVMMCLGEKFTVICADSIDDEAERELVFTSIRNSGKEIIEISEAQNNCFAGNMLQVRNNEGKIFIVMSESAFNSLDSTQIMRLERHGQILSSNISTIETIGGGSVRCMMAEIFLPRIKSTNCP